MATAVRTRPVIEGISLTHFTLTTLLFIATLCNILLGILSTVAWTSSRRWTSSPDGCLSSHAAHVYCGFARWGLFLFFSVGALLCVVATGTMTARILRRSSGNKIDHGYVMRGAFFTVCVYAPLVYLGWADVTVVGPALAETNMGGNLTEVEKAESEPWKLGKEEIARDGNARAVLFEGITGAFILQSMDAGVPTAEAAMMAAHLCLFFGLLITGIAAATARSFPPKTNDVEHVHAQESPPLTQPATASNWEQAPTHVTPLQRWVSSFRGSR